MKGAIIIFSLACFVNSVLGNNIECLSHYCECQPFLPKDLSLKKSLFFNKYPYPEHYAILGRAKELHCCIGGNFTSITWLKDDEPYPWTNFGSSLPILFAKNQSLVIVNMTPKDEGQYKCVASNGEENIDHQTMLRSYSLPNYHHLPVWNEEPMDHIITEGENQEINCSAVVGPQYNSIKLQPVKAYWKNAQGQILNSDVTEAIQDVSNDEMVYGIKLKLQEVTTENSGKYSCVIANHYGVLTKSINIEVVAESNSIHQTKPQIDAKLLEIFRSQSKIYDSIIRLGKTRSANDILRSLRSFKFQEL